ncbi:MAG: hypothetical protein HYS74_00545 [Parcubacteria group bacterium]|nr:hypothetical protein [Parcubacteria group bacterium]
MKHVRSFFLNPVFFMLSAGLAYSLALGNDLLVWPTTGNPINYAYMMLIAFAQNVSFTMVSRARNRNSMPYHMVAAWFSNGIWFATFAYLVHFGMSWSLFIPYTCGTVAGSLTGATISMWIERMLGATSDAYVPTKLTLRDAAANATYEIRVVRGVLETREQSA